VNIHIAMDCLGIHGKLHEPQLMTASLPD